MTHQYKLTVEQMIEQFNTDDAQLLLGLELHADILAVLQANTHNQEVLDVFDKTFKDVTKVAIEHVRQARVESYNAGYKRCQDDYNRLGFKL